MDKNKDNESVFDQYFDRVESKIITKTDKHKSAIVPTKPMRDLLENIGVVAETKSDKSYSLRDGKLLDGTRINFTYYNSTRKQERLPEPRIGKSDLINRVEIGDLFYVIDKKGQLFFHTQNTRSPTAELEFNIAEEAAAYLLDGAELFRKARRDQKGQPRRIGGSNQFIRDPQVTAFIKKASGRKCQMPDCSSKLFKTDSGERYIEVHHIVPLSEGGDDVIENCMALCPRCHRLMHHGESRMKYRKRAIESMESIYRQWEAKYT